MTRTLVVNHPQPRPQLAGRPRLAAFLATQRTYEAARTFDDRHVQDAVRRVRDAVLRGDPLVRTTVALMSGSTGAGPWLAALNRMTVQDRATPMSAAYWRGWRATV